MLQLLVICAAVLMLAECSVEREDLTTAISRADFSQPRQWLSVLMFWEDKCKVTQETRLKHQHQILRTRKLRKKCERNLQDKVNTATSCSVKQTSTSEKQSALRSTAKNCGSQVVTLRKELSNLKATYAKCDSSLEYLRSQRSALREAYGQHIAENRVLFRDLMECDGNKEHCEENEEECEFRCERRGRDVALARDFSYRTKNRTKNSSRRQKYDKFLISASEIYKL